MAKEKNWKGHQNIVVSETDDVTTAQNWMYNLYHMLSGGLGTDDGKWEILSASNGTTDGPGGGAAGKIQDASSFTFGTGAHSWFLARSPSKLLPATGSMTNRYIYFTVDCVYADDTDVYFVFDHTEPTSDGDVNARPAETAGAYEKQQQYRIEYDVGNPTYFSGMMNDTGSFFVVTSQNAVSTYNYHGAVSCLRYETPRSASIDPFPIFLKTGFDTNTTYHGVWGNGGTNAYYSRLNGHVYSYWGYVGGQAVWDIVPGNVGDPDNPTNGHYASIPTYCGGQGSSYGWWSDMKVGGSPIDGTYPQLPLFVISQRNNLYSTVRGRLPDMTTGIAASDIGGATVPATGTPEFCLIGDTFLPFTASILPGV